MITHQFGVAPRIGIEVAAPKKLQENNDVSQIVISANSLLRRINC